MIYLIGVDHKVQHNGDPNFKLLTDKFREFLKYEAMELNAKLIAEEFSLEALNISQASIATAKDVADALGLEHRFCDPTTEERKTVGILLPSQFRTPEDKKEADLKREKIWFERISDSLNKEVIFICGFCHLMSFNLLIKSKGIKSRIHNSDWKWDIPNLQRVLDF